MSILDNIRHIQKEIAKIAKDCNRNPSSIRLIAVSKRHSIDSIKEAIEAGQLQFGENYIQEAAEKIHNLDPTAVFHFIGHIQSNKAKLAAELFPW